MYALLALNGNSPDVRVIAVSPKMEYLKTFLAKPMSYWWTNEGRMADVPRLTWRPREMTPWGENDTDTEEAVFVGELFGKSVTKLQIKKVESP